MEQQLVTRDTLQDLGADGQERDWTVVARVFAATFFVDRRDMRAIQTVGNLPCLKDRRHILVRGTANSSGALFQDPGTEVVRSTRLVNVLGLQ